MIAQQIADELHVHLWQVEATVKLIDEGNTIPFIARYRKEVTGQLNDEQLRDLSERLEYLRNLEEKKQQVISSIEEQGKMTEELRRQILEASTMVAVDDLYRPYRPKRRTRATDARDKGLQGLADILLAQSVNRTLEEEAEAYVDAEKGVADAAAAIQGAKDIVAEQISDTADYRTAIRQMTWEQGILSSSGNEEETSVYDNYKKFSSAVAKLQGNKFIC